MDAAAASTNVTKGLIRREIDAADTRAKRLRVTDRGAELAVRALATVEAADASFFQTTPDSAPCWRCCARSPAATTTDLAKRRRQL